MCRGAEYQLKVTLDQIGIPRLSSWIHFPHMIFHVLLSLFQVVLGIWCGGSCCGVYLLEWIEYVTKSLRGVHQSPHRGGYKIPDISRCLCALQRAWPWKGNYEHASSWLHIAWHLVLWFWAQMDQFEPRARKRWRLKVLTILQQWLESCSACP